MRIANHPTLTTTILLALAVAMPTRSTAQASDRSTLAAAAGIERTPAAAGTSETPRPTVATPASLARQPLGVAMTRHTATDSTTPPLPAPPNTNKGNTKLMLVGVGAMIVGSIVDGDAGTIILLGGAALGGFGLYRYLSN